MPRNPRKLLNTSFYHIMTQGINKYFIFNNSTDIKYYIKTMYKLLKQHNIEIISYCIMNNHAHILIKSNNIKDLSKYMQRLNTIYGIYYNKKYDRVGYVFRDRYKSEGIYSQNHLYNCINYIYNNPVKANICKHPKDYPYSNYKKVKNFKNDEYSFIDTDEDIEIIIDYFINSFLKKHNISLDLLKKNNDLLKELVVKLRQIYNISYRTISKKINISRETIRTIYNKHINLPKSSVPNGKNEATDLRFKSVAR